MPTSTYTPLANLTLGSSASSVTFSSISGSYRDLILVMNATTDGGNYISLRLNSDSGSNYSQVMMGGNGSVTQAGSQSDTRVQMNYYHQTATSSAVNIISNIMDYSATDKHKTILVRENKADAGVEAQAARWANTSAVTTLTLGLYYAGSFTAGSTFALYGIAS